MRMRKQGEGIVVSGGVGNGGGAVVSGSVGDRGVQGDKFYLVEGQLS